MSHPTNYLVKNGTCEKLEDVADPDITGLGVVISFIVSISFNFVAIIMAYFFRWLPEPRYSLIDDAFVRFVRSFCPDSISSSHILPEHEREEQIKERELKRSQRIRAFESFMVSMSDQQLITGVALIVTTTFMSFDHHLSNSFSVYSFQVATRLGYFSCIVHLCTISLLREHFDTHKRLRNFRLMLVAMILVLLITCMVVSDSVTFRFNRHISVQCARHNFRFIDPERPGYVGFSDEVVVTFNLIVLILVILLGYARRFLEIYSKDARKDYKVELLLTKLRNYDRSSRGYTSIFNFWVLILKTWVESISTSLLWDIIWLSFYLAFGMGNFWTFYEDADLKLEMEPNFGQVVPLILVFLPFLSAWEAFSATIPTNTATFTATVQTETSNSGQSEQNREYPALPRSDIVISCSDANTSKKSEGILEMVQKLGISTLWFKVGTFLYWVGLVVWALMFADVIPGYGAFYVSIIACVIFTVFVIASVNA
ncbi:hypothetical protein LY78DRAFT_657712 [Colletotrichum sublineola]|nr:hypothetical protein LY78DRAFT_657712 [Colletotrichum sublineola]